MRRRSFLAALAAAALPAPARAARERFTRGLLWRVTRPGSPPSHVYGTIHDADPRLAALPAPVGAVLREAKCLMLEFLPSAYTAERFLEAALFDDGRTLEGAIGAEDFARAVEMLAPIGLPREVLNRLKPWGALINLRSPRSAGGETLDARLIAAARARRLPVFQIEGVEEQIFTFDECPMDTQVALLRHALHHRDELLALQARTLDAYLAGDLAGIARLRAEAAARHPEIAPHQAVMDKRVLYDRSVVMAYRMQRELRRGGALVALGALHLYGAKGVLALLEQDGYRAARVL
ncbi:MAG TPA: TraB/GumN family protein [Burkholderiales bacterium]